MTKMLHYTVEYVCQISTSVSKTMNLPSFSYASNYQRIICQATGRVVTPLMSSMFPRPPSTPPPPHIVPSYRIIHPLPPPLPPTIHILVRAILKPPLETPVEIPIEIPKALIEPPIEIPKSLIEPPVEIPKAPIEIPKAPIEIPKAPVESVLKAGSIKMAGIVIPVIAMKPTVVEAPVIIAKVAVEAQSEAEKKKKAQGEAEKRAEAEKKKNAIRNLNLGPDHMPEDCEGNCKKHPLMTPQMYEMAFGGRFWGNMIYDRSYGRVI
jgi:hypothetical protein